VLLTPSAGQDAAELLRMFIFQLLKSLLAHAAAVVSVAFPLHQFHRILHPSLEPVLPAALVQNLHPKQAIRVLFDLHAKLALHVVDQLLKVIRLLLLCQTPGPITADFPLATIWP